MPLRASNPLERLYRTLPSCVRRQSRNVQSVTFREVETVDELKAAARIVYQEYLKRGYISPQLSKLRLSIFHVLPDTKTFVAVHRDYGVIGTVALIQDSPLGLPMDDICHPELEALRQQGQRLAEVSMLAFDTTVESQHALPRFHGRHMMRTLRLFKAMFDHLRVRTNVTEMIACFHPRHQLLYDFLHMEPLTGIKPYASVNGHPALARHLNLARTERLADTYPVLRYFYGRPRSLQRPANKLLLSMENMQDLFVRSSSIFATASAETMTYIQICYPAYQLSPLFGASSTATLS